MNSISLVFLLGLIAFANGQKTVTGTISLPVPIQANTLTTVNFGFGVLPSLQVLVDADTNVTLNLFLPFNFTSLFGGLPKGYNSISLSTAIGYIVQFANETALRSASLTTAALDTIAQQLINATGRAGALSFSASTNSFLDVPVSVAQNKLTIPVQQSATYIFTAAQSNAATPNIYGRIRTLLANTTSAIAYATNFTTNFIIQVTPQANADLNVIFSSLNPAPNAPPANWVPLGSYWDITAAGTSVNAVLNYTYTNAQLTAAGVTADTLRFAFYNTTSASWELVAGAKVDTVNNVVSQAVSHFSQWGVVGSAQAAGTSQQGSGTSNTADAQGIVACVFLSVSCLLAVL